MIICITVVDNTSKSNLPFWLQIFQSFPNWVVAILKKKSWQFRTKNLTILTKVVQNSDQSIQQLYSYKEEMFYWNYFKHSVRIFGTSIYDKLNQDFPKYINILGWSPPPVIRNKGLFSLFPPPRKSWIRFHLQTTKGNLVGRWRRKLFQAKII